MKNLLGNYDENLLPSIVNVIGVSVIAPLFGWILAEIMGLGAAGYLLGFLIGNVCSGVGLGFLAYKKIKFSENIVYETELSEIDTTEGSNDHDQMELLAHQENTLSPLRSAGLFSSAESQTPASSSSSLQLISEAKDNQSRLSS